MGGDSRPRRSVIVSPRGTRGAKKEGRLGGSSGATSDPSFRGDDEERPSCGEVGGGALRGGLLNDQLRYMLGNLGALAAPKGEDENNGKRYRPMGSDSKRGPKAV